MTGTDDATAPLDEGPAPRLTPVQAALIAETCSRGEVIWLRPSGLHRPRAAWHIWHDDAICVLSGTGEQALPVLSGAVEVIARGKDSLARLVTFVAHAYPVPTGTAQWLEATADLAAHRLNEPDPTAARQRWASQAVVTMLRPIQLISSGNGSDQSRSGAAIAARGPGTTLGRMPFHLGRRRGRSDR